VPWVWTDDRLEELKRLWVEEALASNEVAQRMGITRGTVMGKINRLGLLRHRAVLSLARLSEGAETSQEPASPPTAASDTPFLKHGRPRLQRQWQTSNNLPVENRPVPLSARRQEQACRVLLREAGCFAKALLPECCLLAYVPTRLRR
jgi:hypothetical protein